MPSSSRTGVARSEREVLPRAQCRQHNHIIFNNLLLVMGHGYLNGPPGTAVPWPVAVAVARRAIEQSYRGRAERAGGLAARPVPSAPHNFKQSAACDGARGNRVMTTR